MRTQMKAISIILSVVLLLGLLAGCGSKPSSQAQSGGQDNSKSQDDKQQQEAKAFYADQTLEMLVPFNPGGGTDVFARFVVPFLNKHIEGNPAIQVVNVGGGGSITGANEYVLQREHNGYNALVTSASTHAPYLLGQPAVKYDLKEMKPVMGLPTGGVVYASPTTGINEPKDVLNPKEKLVYAGISATGLDLVTLLSFEVLGMDVQAILGYEGRGPSRVAFEQGESNIDYQTSSAYLTNVTPLVQEGKAKPLFSFGQLDENGDIVRDPAFPDIPSLKEFYIEVHGKEPSGVAWDAYKTFVGSSFTVQKVIWLHSDAPQEAVEALKKGTAAMAKDPEFSSKGEEVLGGYEPYVGDTVEKVVSNMLNVSDDVLSWVRNFLKEKYGVTNLEG